MFNEKTFRLQMLIDEYKTLSKRCQEREALLTAATLRVELCLKELSTLSPRPETQPQIQTMQ